ncbi:MAG: hypothetical protein IKY94_06365 [Lachnospiraceae bacterium]|nr:hypothetical protein [Clostridia bacterium]MBR4982163.1 hypothetical protein [Lachnospiraceae bacterium]
MVKIKIYGFLKYCLWGLFIISLAPPAYADPITILAVTGAVAAIASTAIGVTATIVQTKQQKAISNYQRQVNEQNAKASREAAQAKIENQRRAAKFTYGTQLARLGGMGALAEGSPLDIMGQSAGQQEYDNMVTEYEGEVQSIQFQQQAVLNKYEADIAQYNMGLNIASQVAKGVASASTSLLGGAGGLAAGTPTGVTPSITGTTGATGGAGYAGTLPQL